MAKMQENVVDLLIDQHNQIRTLFVDVAAATGDRKREAFEDLVRLLAVHESAEEAVVHPTARRKIDNGEEIVDERLGEEKQAKQSLAELYDLGVEHVAFDDRLRSLAELIAVHSTAEETEEFGQLRACLTEDELRRMAGVLKTAEAVAPTRPHPMAGESAVANVVTGPPLALFDRVRDAVRDWRSR